MNLALIWLTRGYIPAAALTVADTQPATPDVYVDPFAADPPSTDPARDQANHRELARVARRMMGERPDVGEGE